MDKMEKLAGEDGTPVRDAPWPAWPDVDEEDVQAVADVVRSGCWGVGGPAVPAFERAFAEFQGAQYGIAVTSGTAALQVALTALGIGPGDEVIVPTYTFVASASAVLLAGATPVLVDVEPDTYNLDPDATEQAITPRTKAIMPVHFSGAVVDMERFSALSRKYNLPIVEDACHAHGARYAGRGLGTLGNVGGFSFQSSKNLAAGEGGIILTNDETIARLCRSLVNLGRTQGGVWYEHHLPAGNYRMTEMQAALLLSQMRRLAEQTRRRDANGQYLDQCLSELKGIRPMRREPRQELHSYHLYMFRYDAENFGMPRARFLELLNAEGVPASTGYPVPLHHQPLFSGQGLQEQIPGRLPTHLAYDYSRLQCPNAERACATEAVWLSQSLLLGERADMDDIVHAVQKISTHARAKFDL